MKRVLCMILALLMILSITACGTTTDDPSEGTGADNTQVVTEADTDFFPDIEKKDYQGETFRMIGWSSPEAWYYSESYNSDAEDGASVLGNALYERNTMIEDYLGVKMEYEFCYIRNFHFGEEHGVYRPKGLIYIHDIVECAFSGDQNGLCSIQRTLNIAHNTTRSEYWVCTVAQFFMVFAVFHRDKVRKVPLTENRKGREREGSMI